MYSHDELTGLFDFLRATNEGNLKKMLCSGKMTEVHLRMLLKVTRAVNVTEFITHLEAGTFPKVKTGTGEAELKETFWGVCTEACMNLGLLTAAKKAA